MSREKGGENMLDRYLAALADYAVGKGLIEKEDRTWAVNSLLQVLNLQEYQEPEEALDLPLDQVRPFISQAVERLEAGESPEDVFGEKLA